MKAEIMKKFLEWVDYIAYRVGIFLVLLVVCFVDFVKRYLK
jgi:hypothetical protein